MQKSLKTGMMLLLAFAFATLAISASADTVVYHETFDSGTPLASDPLINVGAINSYWQDQTVQGNGIVAKCTGGGACAPSGNPIDHDASGTGYFLFENTNGGNGSGADVFFESSTFSVNQNTVYTISFELSNATTCCFADISTLINGSQVGSDAFANGPSDNLGSGTAWQTFSFSWNSGSNTTAHIDFLDLNTAGDGNDFGIDNIELSTVPEPGTLLMLGTGVLGVGGSLKRRFVS
jgi:hypothetical protein